MGSAMRTDNAALAATRLPKGLPRPHVKPIVHRALFRYRLATARFRRLPDFLIIGVQKCGTTSLYNQLAAHPSVAPALRKEVHFFDEDENFGKGSAWYRAHFSLDRYPSPGRGCITGEATPYYIFHPLVAERVFRTVPSSKLIAVLRNPVERAYSQYHHQVRVGAESRSFEEALDYEQTLPPDPRERFQQDSGNFKHHSYLSRGIYVEQLQAWEQFFPRDQMLVLKTEELAERPETVLTRVFEFLDVSPWQPKESRRDHKASYSPINPDTRQQLSEFFRPHNQRLYEYLGTDMGWD